MWTSRPWTLQCCSAPWPSWSPWCSTVRIFTTRWHKRSPLDSSSHIFRGKRMNQYVWTLIILTCFWKRWSDVSFFNFLVSFFSFLFFFFFDSRTDQDIQTYTIAVINALFLKAPEEKRQVRLHCAHAAHTYFTAYAVHIAPCSSAFLDCNMIFMFVYLCLFWCLRNPRSLSHICSPVQQ